MTADLFDDPGESRTGPGAIAPGAAPLRGLTRTSVRRLLVELDRIAAAAPFRHMVTPGGHRVSVAMTNRGEAGWVTDRAGHRYDRDDPLTGKPWPAMPRVFLDLAGSAAAAAGFASFAPDARPTNRYQPGARLTLHQDRNEAIFAAPIVSVSLGLPATFLPGMLRRVDPVRRVPLAHGDVVVWGGTARLAYHGVAPLKDGAHLLPKPTRVNSTFRRAP